MIILALFIMLIGIPGSGKSTVAQSLAKNHNATVVSTDRLRQQFTGSAENFSMDNFVFSTAHRKIRTLLMQDKNAIYDATSLTRNDRKKVLNIIPERAIKKCYFINISLSSALARNANRKRVVPRQVIIKMHERLQPPSLEEGWDAIEIIHEE